MSKYLAVLLASAAIHASAAVINTASGYGECTPGPGHQTIECEEGYRCDIVNPNYSQCVPDYYPAPVRPREAEAIPEAEPENASSGVQLEKRQQSNTPIRGAQSIGGACYNRRKIQTLQTNYPDQWNMFLVALRDFMLAPESLDVSWFGVAGIHGAPHIPWQQPASGTYNTWAGYCPHGGPVFVPWHRPYTLLVEQLLQSRAVAIAARFTGTRAAAYRTAADQLRLPYWDWSDPVTRSFLPNPTMQSSVTVTVPSSDGTPVSSTVPNPLFQYTFRDRNTLQRYFSGNFANWMFTTRNPTSTGVAQNANANTAMANGFTTRRAATFQAFQVNNFNQFAQRLESTHNGVHTAVGGPNPLGHMSTTNAAAFDPLFWLHHCNVDRLAAMYQAIYPLNKLEPSNAIETYARIVPGIDGPQDNLNTNLYPFKQGSGAWWKPNDIKSAGTIWKYKYGFEEVPCESNGQVTADQLSSFTRTKVNSLYGTTLSASVKPRDYSGEVVVRNDYTLRCVIDSAEIPGSWTLHIFFGKPPTGSTAEYRLASNRIGNIAAFGTPFVRHKSMIYANELPITDSMREHGCNLDKKQAIKFLQENLTYRITSGDDRVTDIPIKNLKTFRLGVYTAEGSYPDPHSDQFPTWGEKKYLFQITKDMPGGAKHERELLFPKKLDGSEEDESNYGYRP